MPMLIDGHNLIPKIPGLHLRDPDDEMRLVEMLQVYLRYGRKGPVECFFDKAPVGYPHTQMVGVIKVHFALPGKTADSEIEARLDELGKQARNWVVVSADQRVRRAAREVGAQDISSDDFARELLSVLNQPQASAKPSGGGKPEDRKLSADEVAQWMEMFRNRSEDQDK